LHRKDVRAIILTLVARYSPKEGKILQNKKANCDRKKEYPRTGDFPEFKLPSKSANNVPGRQLAKG
jgi:hypothetical protein